MPHTKACQLLRKISRFFRDTTQTTFDGGYCDMVNSHKSVPGRSMMILARDAAAPNHPRNRNRITRECSGSAISKRQMDRLGFYCAIGQLKLLPPKRVTAILLTRL